MPPETIHWYLNLASAAGIAILAIPVWSLNYRKKKLKAITDALPEKPETFKEKVRKIAHDKWGRAVSDWRGIDEICLWIGYVLLLGSAIARLFVPLC